MSWALAALVLLPLAGAAAVACVPRRGLAVAVTVGAATAVLTGLVIAAAAGGELRLTLAGWRPPLGIELRVDALSAVLLGLNAVVFAAVAAFAGGDERVTGGRAFWPLALALWSSLNAVYVSGDLFNVYVALELMGLAAVALVALGGRDALRPALRYLFVAVLGSLLYLVAVALLYAETGTLDLEGVAAAVTDGPVAAGALALVTAGMVLKTALAPVHSWLPGAHASAPSAVSPLLSALVIKGSLYVLLRLWFDVLGVAAGDGAALVVGALGAAAAVWGAALALRERRLKRIVAFSTVAQVGYLVLVLALATPALTDAADPQRVDAAVLGWAGGVTLILAHGVAKTAMFLAAGSLALGYGSDALDRLPGAVARQPASVAAFAIAGVSLAGLPPTFGFVGKWLLVQSGIGGGQWWWVAVLLLGGLLTFGYVARVVRATFFGPDGPDDERLVTPEPVPRRMPAIALALALGSVVLAFASVPLVEFVSGDLPWGGG